MDKDWMELEASYAHARTQRVLAALDTALQYVSEEHPYGQRKGGITRYGCIC